MDEKKRESIYGCGISQLEKPDWEDTLRKEISFMPMFMRHPWGTSAVWNRAG